MKFDVLEPHRTSAYSTLHQLVHIAPSLLLSPVKMLSKDVVREGSMRFDVLPARAIFGRIAQRDTCSKI